MATALVSAAGGAAALDDAGCLSAASVFRPTVFGASVVARLGGTAGAESPREPGAVGGVAAGFAAESVTAPAPPGVGALADDGVGDWS
jgi:hypothetical protein